MTSSTICVCPDSFKGTLDSVQVCSSVEKGLSTSFNTNTKFTFDHCPMTDGGRGFMASSIAALKSKLEIFKVGTVDPYFDSESNPKKNTATFGMMMTDEEITCIVETAEACGIHYYPPRSSPSQSENGNSDDRNPFKATSYGVGELLKAVFEKLAEKVMESDKNKTKNISKIKILIGLGGSATNDGGVGCLQSLGVSFASNDAKINTNPLTAEANNSLSSADFSKMTSFFSSLLKERLSTVASKLQVILVSDVTNPLLGPSGATAVYGPQKGARTQEQRDRLEEGLANLNSVLTKEENSASSSFKDIPGSGAAGGLGGALIFAFKKNNIDVQVCPGAETFAEMINLENRIGDSKTKYVISGEGSFDSQTIQYGKTVAFVASICKKYNKPLIVVCGLCDEEAAKDAASRKPPVLVASTVSKFGKEASLAEPAECLKKVCEEEVSKMIL